MPLNGGSFEDLISLAPGAVSSADEMVMAGSASTDSETTLTISWWTA